MEKLLTREQFKKLVFARSKGLCVFCDLPAVDPHHIMERKLFDNGGYYLNNGAAVCEQHHWDCESTALSLYEVRKAAGITMSVFPDTFDPRKNYDKWGNTIRPDGLLVAGPLFTDLGVKKALAIAGKLRLFVPSGT